MNVLEIEYERRRLVAKAIFDLEDRYALERGTRGAHPQPIGPVTFLLVARDLADGTEEIYEPPVQMVVDRNPSGYYLFFNVVRLTDGSRRERFLPDAPFRVRVEGEFYQAVEVEVPGLGGATSPIPVSLPPGYAYPFPQAYSAPAGPGAPAQCTDAAASAGRGPTLLRGSVHLVDGKGMAGVKVEVVGETQPYVTDETGQWVLYFDRNRPTGNAGVRFELPGDPAPIVVPVPNVCVIQGRTAGLTQTGLRGWVLSASGRPISGARITVDGFAGESTTREDGGWFYYFPLDTPLAGVDQVDVTADLPDGSSQPAPSELIERSVVIVPTFRF